jgi:SpoVK/Ycf46/Vps4 family AAA+-type ATPase
MEKWFGRSTNKPTESNRYKSDVEQANAMKRTVTKRAPSPDDVRLALNGLDQAEAHCQQNKLPAALKLYELSLELLIRVLKEPNVEGREVIEARVQDGLTSAESIKETIKERTQTTQPASQSTKESSTNNFQSLSKALTSALQSGKQQQGRKSQQQRPIPQRQRQHQPPPTTTSNTTVASTASVSTMKSKEYHDTIMTDFLVNPSSDSVQRTTWDDICGLENVKQSLQESAILPLMRPDLFNGLRKAQNILLWGPPGTGKTMLVSAAAQESNCPLFVVTAGTLTSKWMGDSEKLVRALFETARNCAPSIIFIDEVDSLLSSRKSEGEHEASRRLKTEIMIQIEQSSQVLVLACTNCPWDIDSAVLRRFPRRIHVPLPDAPARKGLLENLLKKAKHSLTKSQIKSLVSRTQGYSCSDLSAIASEASFGPLRSIGSLQAIQKVRATDVRAISLEDFEMALERASKSVSPAQLRHYEEWQQQTKHT